MLLDPALDCLEITPSYDRTNQGVASSVLDVVVVKAKPQKIIRVIRQSEIKVQEFSSNPPGCRWI
jgi:hypothetical protein